MTRMTKLFSVLSVVLIAGTFTSLAVLYAKMRVADQEYVPGVDDRVEALTLFFVEAGHAEGVFASHEVECQIYVYETEVADPAAFWKRIDHSAKQGRWKLETDEQVWREYTHADASSDNVRVGLVPSKDGDKLRAVVAWIRISLDIHETKFAERMVWPRFDMLMHTGARFPSELALDH